MILKKVNNKKYDDLSLINFKKSELSWLESLHMNCSFLPKGFDKNVSFFVFAMRESKSCSKM